MKTIIMAYAFVIFLLPTKLVESVCHCPIICENCYKPDDFVPEYGRQLCNNLEAQSECERANWEIKDMQLSLTALIQIVLDDALEKRNMTIMEAAYARSLLSQAIEDEKPEGDCSAGLATDTAMEKTITHCYSPELLEQCQKVLDGASIYQEMIPVKFESYFNSTDQKYDDKMTYSQRSLEMGIIDSDGVIIHPKIVEMIEIVRFRTKIKTARIRCASYNATTEEISAARMADGFVSRLSMLAFSVTAVFAMA